MQRPAAAKPITELLRDWVENESKRQSSQAAQQALAEMRAKLGIKQ